MVIDRAISRFRDFFLAAHGTSQHGSAPVELSFDQAVGKQTQGLMFWWSVTTLTWKGCGDRRYFCLARSLCVRKLWWVIRADMSFISSTLHFAANPSSFTTDHCSSGRWSTTSRHWGTRWLHACVRSSMRPPFGKCSACQDKLGIHWVSCRSCCSSPKSFRVLFAASSVLRTVIEISALLKSTFAYFASSAKETMDFWFLVPNTCLLKFSF